MCDDWQPNEIDADAEVVGASLDGFRSLPEAGSRCDHPAWEIVQPWEFIRKYECRACGSIAMCDCDRDLGTRLPH